MSTNLLGSFEDWVSLRDEWNELVADSVSPSIFLTFEYLSIAWRTFHSQTSELFLITIRNTEGGLVGIAPFRSSIRKHGGFSLKVIEYVTTWETDKLYIIAKQGLEDSCWEEIFSFFQSNPKKWDLIQLVELPNHLAGINKIRRLFCSPSYRCNVAEGPSGPCIDLTVTWDEFCRRHKKFRTKLNRLKKLPDGYEIITYDDPKTIAVGIDRYIEIESLSWKKGQHGLRKNDAHLAFYKEMIPALAQKGRVVIRILVTGDKLVAGDISYTFNDTVYFQHTAYNEEFANYSPGAMLTGLAIKEYLDKAYKLGDCLCGFAAHINPWSSSTIETSNVEIVRLSFRMRLFLFFSLLYGKLKAVLVTRRDGA